MLKSLLHCYCSSAVFSLLFTPNPIYPFYIFCYNPVWTLNYKKTDQIVFLYSTPWPCVLWPFVRTLYIYIRTCFRWNDIYTLPGPSLIKVFVKLWNKPHCDFRWKHFFLNFAPTTHSEDDYQPRALFCYF